MDQPIVLDIIDRATQARNARFSQGLKDLPADWHLGEPLRVGDKVVFTGCYTEGREHLESRAESLGVRVVGSVSRRVAMLVTDDTMDGGKTADARIYGIRCVHPRDFSILLEYLQPTLPVPEERNVRGRTRNLGPSGIDVTFDPVGASPATIRQWARDRGITVGERGRLPAELIDAFHHAYA